MFYENLELLREKNPLLAFTVDFAVEETLAEAEVYFLYDVQDPRKFVPLMEKEICFVFTKPEYVTLFLHSEKAELFLKSPQVSVYLLADEEEYKKIGWRYLFMKRVHSVSSAISDLLEDMLKSIELVASDYREFGVDILQNVYHNLMQGAQLFVSLDLPDCPAIICGAGPSLQQNLENLKRVKDQVLIVGCGSAIPILMKAGIIPDIAAFIDPDPPIKPFEELLEFDMPLLYQNRMSKDIFRLHQGPKIWMGSSYGYEVEQFLLKELGFPDLFLDAGWNVANFAMQAMVTLGIRDLYCIGIDSSYEKEIPESHEWSIQDNEGNQRVTRKDLFMGAKWMEAFAKEHPHVRCVNLGGGLFSNHIEKGDFTMIQGKKGSVVPKSPHNIDQEKCKKLLETLRASLVRAQEIVEGRLATENRRTVPLFDVEIREEIVYNLLLEPLWNIWKHMLLRGQEGELHEWLFFKSVLEKHIKVL